MYLLLFLPPLTLGKQNHFGIERKEDGCIDCNPLHHLALSYTAYTSLAYFIIKIVLFQIMLNIIYIFLILIPFLEAYPYIHCGTCGYPLGTIGLGA